MDIQYIMDAYMLDVLPWLQAWRANMDIQYIMDAYMLGVMYVTSYMMKSENAMGEFKFQRIPGRRGRLLHHSRGVHVRRRF